MTIPSSLQLRLEGGMYVDSLSLHFSATSMLVSRRNRRSTSNAKILVLIMAMMAHQVGLFLIWSQLSLHQVQFDSWHPRIDADERRVPATVNVPKPMSFTVAPKVANDGHRTIVEVALPVVFEVMQEHNWCDKTPLLQAREALRRIDQCGGRFWGEYLTYTRKRTVEDIIVSRYMSELRCSL